MGVRFFGQFLIERGEIDAPQLRSALDLMERENLTLGELAVQAGYASEADCRRVNGEQRRMDRPFGELAVQMGVLLSSEFEELLQRQQETRVTVGEALRRLNFISASQLATLEDEFKRDQAGLDSEKVALPLLLQGNRLAESLVDVFPRYCMRAARLEVKLGEYRHVAEPPGLPLAASLGMVGTPGVEMTLASDLGFAQRLGSGISGLPPESLPEELCLDAIGEFLNVLAGNVMSALVNEGHEYRLEAPRFGDPPRSGWLFEVASDRGRAAFVVVPR